MDVNKGIIDALLNIGVYTGDIDIKSNQFYDIKLPEYINDSVQFISYIVELEQIFEISIDDALLTPDKFDTFGDVYRIVLDSKKNQQSF